MKTARENFFHNLGKSEVFHKATKREPNPRALRKADFLAEKIGVAFVEAVRSSYDRFLESPENPKRAENFRKWRLRLHLKLENDQERLDLLNEHFGLGLYDEAPGPLCFDYMVD